MEESRTKRKQSYVLKAAVFALIAIALSFVCVVGAVIEMQYSKEYVSILFKVLIIVGILVYALIKKEFHLLWEGRYFTLFLLFAFIPGVLNFLRAVGHTDSYPSTSLVITTVLNVLTTVIWEELYFRYVGKSLFWKDGKLTLCDYFILVTVFAATHFVNMLFYSPISVFVQVFEAFACGAFWVVLYYKTNNILVSITSHFVGNLSAGLFSIYVSYSARFFTKVDYIFTILLIVFDLAFAVYFLIKNKVFKKQQIQEHQF